MKIFLINMKISLRDKKISRWNIILFLRDKIISPWDMKIQNFLMWFKNGLKAQKLLAQDVWGKHGVFNLWVKLPS